VAAGASGGAVVSWQWHGHGNSGDEWLRQPHNLVAPTARLGRGRGQQQGRGDPVGLLRCQWLTRWSGVATAVLL